MKSEDFITNLLEIKDPNITILEVVDSGSHKEVITKLDSPAPKCHNCRAQTAKYDFQKPSKIPYLECAGYKILIRLRKRRFRCPKNKRRQFLSSLGVRMVNPLQLTKSHKKTEQQFC